MAPAIGMSLSIQAFFPSLPGPKPINHSIGDGFSEQEIDAVIHPKINGPWVPEATYTESEIGYIDTGPRCVTFKGRVANLFNQATPSKRPKAAKGCIKFILKDDTGCISVRSYADLVMGKLLTHG